MRELFTSIVVVSAVVGAVPAAAQYATSSGQNGAYGQNPGQYGTQFEYETNGNVSARIWQLEARIEAGVRNGTMSNRNAYALRRQAGQLRQIEAQYRRNGVSGQEQSDLQQRLRNLRQQVRTADGGRGFNDQNNQSGNGGYANSGRIDQDRDGFDDRDYDRNGRLDDDANRGGYNDDAYGRNTYNGGPYQQTAPRSGLGGLLGSVIGNRGLRAGQRASGNLGAVPYQHQNQFRDGNGVYYRSDGRQIYQIDARSQTVLQVYSLGQ